MTMHPAQTVLRSLVLSVPILLAVQPSPLCGGDNPSVRTLADANTAFGLDLFAQLRTLEGNLFFSPFSISCALGMTAAGASGETQLEMQETLRLPDNADSAFERLLDALSPDSSETGALLRIANSLWPQAGEQLRQPFKHTVETVFGAGIVPLDYQRDTEGARRTINAWVADRTHNRIPELLGEGVLTPMTRMVLANAIYFKGDWSLPFDPELTRNAPFYVSPADPVDVPMMFREDQFAYAEDTRAQWVELTYAASDIAMTILLPRPGEDLYAIEAALCRTSIADRHAALESRTVELRLPRFRINTRFLLNQPLQALGMKRAFSPDKADFSGMRETRDDLHIDTVVHQAFVEVDETGTEAAAATAVAMRMTAIQPSPAIFRADRPFLFWIRHVPTGTLLFMGRLADPSGQPNAS